MVKKITIVASIQLKVENGEGKVQISIAPSESFIFGL